MNPIEGWLADENRPTGGFFLTRIQTQLSNASNDVSRPIPPRPTSTREECMSDVMIQVENLTKDYGPARAVDKVTFNVRKGEVLGFLGPNGAGKSTTMKMLTCFLSPTAGTAKVAGHDVFDESLEVRR